MALGALLRRRFARSTLLVTSCDLIDRAVTQDIPAEVRAYGATSPAFPHESTANQWFSESQFESYRKLGYYQVSKM